MSANERQPLLQNVEKVKASAPPSINAEKLLALPFFYATNVPWFMVVVNMCKWFLHVCTVMTSWWYLEANWRKFTPKCYEYDGHQIGLQIMCYSTGFCFWTFPLLCAFMVIITFWRHLYITRLYYECLLHRVLLNYSNNATTKSAFTWIFIAYGCLALSVSSFVEEQRFDVLLHEPMTKNVGIYVAPLLSFFMVFLSMWQVENQLLPLPKFYELNPDLAQEVLANAVYAPDSHLRVAFEEVEEALDARKYDEQLTSSEYFALVAEAVNIEMQRAKQAVKDIPPEDNWLESLALGSFQEYANTYPVSRPEVLTWSYGLSRGNWWVHRLLHSRHFSDERAEYFRRWAWLYIAVSGFALLCLLEAYIGTGVDWFRTQRKMSSGLI